MKTIIAGSRKITGYNLLLEAIQQSWTPTQVICGGAPGVDYLGSRWAKEHDVPLVMVLADWARIGRAAGILRNKEMVGIAEGLIAVWDGKSPGTQHIIEEAQRRSLRVHVYVPHAAEVR